MALQAAAQTVQSAQLSRSLQSQIFRLRVARKSFPEHALHSLAQSTPPRHAQHQDHSPCALEAGPRRAGHAFKWGPDIPVTPRWGAGYTAG